ncbi:MAG: hypothetical protein IJB33_02385 [Akkermansia sp.]|nr:hypothetical protein [Akkermansia sp.]MBQ7022791.1 hypothetical protein [Akkermansia sp.]
MRLRHILPLMILGSTQLTGCTGLLDAVLHKRIAPEVQQAAQKEDNWYTYMPHRAPGFCLRTRRAIVWKDSGMNLGYWRGLHPQAPHRVLMEARGDTLILHRRYVWDGNSVGTTHAEDLMPSLRHDVLYHALKEGAPLSRAAIDRAYRADCQRYGATFNRLHFITLRLFGGLFNRLGQHGTLIIRPITPQTPPTPLEPNRFDDPYDDLGYTPPDA